MQTNDNETINITLNNNEALVLFEFLSRLNKEENDSLFVDQSEQKVVWNIEALLEKQLTATFKENYSEILKNARCAVRDKE